METRPLRRQYRSCDQCRKGKRACDGKVPESLPEGSPTRPGADISPRTPCSNCTKWRKDCTYNWLSAAPGERCTKKPRRDIAGSETANADATDSAFTNNLYQQQPFGFVTPLLAESFESLPSASCVSDQSASMSSSQGGFTAGVWGGSSPELDASGQTPFHIPILSSPFGQVAREPETRLSATFCQNNAIPPPAIRSSRGQNTFQSSTRDLKPIDYDDYLLRRLLESDDSSSRYPGAAGDEYISGLSPASNDLTDRFERSALIKNMFRIYHDSMENALSCWLAEQNCPYSVVVAGNPLAPDAGAREGGPNCPNSSNRIFSRVLRLDRAFGAFRGRQLTDVEDKRASRALLSAIMAFASQWATQPSQRAVDFDTSQELPAEHFSRENLWNQAHRALDASAGISSFRVIFANIVFSLTQRPLNVNEHIGTLDSMAGRSGNQINEGADDARSSKVDELQDLLDNDYAPQFIESAARQLFTFRYKLTHLQRKVSNSAGRRESILAPSQTSQSPLEPEDNETFNLLFWLGIMFDTLSAAMHQRPPVVSDEDSEISCAASVPQSQSPQKENEDSVSPVAAKRPALWGDLFLAKDVTNEGLNIPRWPCSHEEAEKTLCDAAPVKVLLFRRISRIQTLIYRGSGPERLEEAVRDTLQVYYYWNSTYGRFIVDCTMHHDSLPPRIQSWYVILAGHWHLAAMILADTLESLDRAEVGLDSHRESRRTTGLAATLRKENAIAVSNLAYYSLHGEDLSFAKTSEFHDSVNERAMLTEPWTAVLTRSFTKAGYNLLKEVDASPHAVHPAQNDLLGQALLQCGYCLDGLLCLGRKSDVAFLVARILSSRVDKTLHERVTYSVPGCYG